MHYSRLLLNLQSSQVRRDLANDHEMHRTVMSAFPTLNLPKDGDQRQRQSGDSGSILWRVDHDPRRGIAMLIVQSDSAPDWQPLLKRYPGYVTPSPDSDLDPISTMERHLSFHPGQRLKFRLRANPTRKIKSDGRKNGQRLGLTTPDEQRAWLERKASDATHPNGFRLIHFDTIPDPAARRQRVAPRTTDDQGVATATQSRTHVAVLFEGILEVTDPEQLQHTLRAGIGSAKAFGFGLLSVAPV